MAVMPWKFGMACNADQMITAARTVRREGQKNYWIKVSDPTGMRSIPFKGAFVILQCVLVIASTQEVMDAAPTKVLSCELLASCSRQESR